MSFPQSLGKVLISGTNSGLGKYLQEHFQSISWNRDISNSLKAELQREGVDFIIHCAFNSSKDITSDNLYQYIQDNVLLTLELTKIQHKKFFYISTVDVYPKDSKGLEDEVIQVDKVNGLYPLTKLISEGVVQNNSKNYLILRCSGLLGKYSRKNNLLKIIEDDNPTLSLSIESEQNFILHTDLIKFIERAMEQDLTGIINLVSSKNVKLKEVAKLVKKKVTFGNFTYQVGKINNSKAQKLLSIFKKTSKDVVEEFLLYKRGTIT